MGDRKRLLQRAGRKVEGADFILDKGRGDRRFRLSGA